MNEFIFVIDGVELLNLSNLGIDFLVLLTQIAIAFFAGYAVFKGREIYREQKEIDRLEEKKKKLVNKLKPFFISRMKTEAILPIFSDENYELKYKNEKD